MMLIPQHCVWCDDLPQCKVGARYFKAHGEPRILHTLENWDMEGWYQGHTKKPNNSSSQKHQPYVLFGNTGLGFQMVGATGGARRRWVACNQQLQPSEIPTMYIRKHVGLVFLVGPPSVALVWEWCGCVDDWRSIGQGTLIFNGCSNSNSYLVDFVEFVDQVVQPPNKSGLAFDQLILLNHWVS